MSTYDDDPTRKASARPIKGEAALSLSVMTERGPLKVTLPTRGSLVIGRSVEADVRLDHDSVSRRHARVDVSDAVTVEDLGSSNGTYLHDRALAEGEKVTVRPGEVFFVGEVLCLMQGAAQDPQRRLWSVGRMMKKLDAHCADAARSSGAPCLLRVRALGLPHAGFEAQLLDMVGAADRVAPIQEGSEALVLLVGRDAAEVDDLSALLRARLGGVGRTVLVAAATYPRHGADAASLAAHTKGAVESVARVDDGPDVVVISPAMQRLHRSLERVAQGSISVLLLGEMGVGKEVFASRLHALSPRASQPYVKFNCAAFCETLVDGELFGHEKGAFTGAATARSGLIESADKGTVFLDEVGELSPAVQAKLLRVLEARCVRRVGATTERPVDVRFVAATNRDLKAECAAGRFRRDLYFRLAGVSLEIPPLRERAEEIEALARRFLARSLAQAGRGRSLAFSDDALATLHRHAWPGNIRELRNAVERAVLLCESEAITPADLALDVPSPASATSAAPPVSRDLSASEQGDRARVVEALERCLWNQSAAARQLGMSRKALIARIEKYHLPRPHKGRAEA